MTWQPDERASKCSSRGGGLSGRGVVGKSAKQNGTVLKVMNVYFALANFESGAEASGRIQKDAATKMTSALL